MEESQKKRQLFQLRDILFVLAIFLSNDWIMVAAIIGFLVSVVVQFRDDWKVYHRFDIFTVIYICVSVGIVLLLVHLIVSLTNS